MRPDNALHREANRRAAAASAALRISSHADVQPAWYALYLAVAVAWLGLLVVVSMPYLL